MSNVINNRNVVYRAQEIEGAGVVLFQDNENVIYGYMYEPNGSYTKYSLIPDLDNIARFICSNQKEKLICNKSDLALASTMGSFLDIAVESFRTKILPYLMKYQMGSAEIQPFEEIGTISGAEQPKNTEYHVVEITETLQKSVMVRGNAEEALATVEDYYYGCHPGKELEVTCNDLVDTTFKVSASTISNFVPMSENEHADGIWNLESDSVPYDAFKTVLSDDVMGKMREVFANSCNDTSKDDEINSYSNRELFDKWLTYHGITGCSEKILDMMCKLFGVNLE